ncbi:MAG: cyclase family protein [Actinomycetota bacterium]
MIDIKIYDLSLVISEDLPTYPGDPVVRLVPKVEYKFSGYNVTSVSMGTHSGTHIDAPLHMLERGGDINTLPLNCFFGLATYIDIPKQSGTAITETDLGKIEIPAGDILIVRTGWEDMAYRKGYFTDFPYFSSQAAQYLISRKLKALGTDMPSVDGPEQKGAFHKEMLAAGIPLIEALVGLKQVCGQRMYFSALPLNIKDADGSPVRAAAIKL